MAHVTIAPFLRRLPVLAVLAAAIAACNPQAATTKPPVPTPEPASPAATQPPAVVPSPDASALEPLPAYSVDSDLEPEDQAAIENLLESDMLQAYLPADLINDGGVILYQTLALRDDRADDRVPVQTTQTAPRPAPTSGWKRLDVERGGRQLTLRQDVTIQGPGAAKAARVVVRYPMRGAFVYRDTSTGNLARKRYVQMFERVFHFQLADGRWTLAGFSPIHMESQGGRSGLEIASFKVFADGAAEPSLALTQRDRVIAPDEAPTFQAGQRIRLEAAVEDARGDAVYVYAHMAGRSDRTRQMLVDDGTGGDKTAGDGVYTGIFVVPATEGLRHFGLDVLDPASFTPGGLYRGNAIGLSFRVEDQP